MDKRQTTMITRITSWSSLPLVGGEERQAKRGKYAVQTVETTTTETTMEKMTTKKSIPNLFSTHPRAEKAPEPILHASWE